MKEEEVKLHLQTLFRNKNKKHTQALAAFFTNGPQEDIFPLEVATPKCGTWVFVESGNQKQPNMMYKTWAIYERVVEEDASEGEDSGEKLG